MAWWTRFLKMAIYIMRSWKLIGAGLLISVLVRGCPNTPKQSTNPADKQPLQALNSPKEFSPSSQLPSSLPKLRSISPVSQFLPTATQAPFLSTPIARHHPADSKKPQSVSSQISANRLQHKEASSRVIQQQTEPVFDVFRVQTNIPVDEKSSQSLINQVSDQNTQERVLELPKIETQPQPAPENKINQVSDQNTQERVLELPKIETQLQPAPENKINRASEQHAQESVLELPKIETKPQPASENKSEPLSVNSLNPALRSYTYTSTNDEKVAPPSQRFSPPVFSSSSESGSGRCNYPWEFDSASNRCGERAASEQPNFNTRSTIGSYSSPTSSYSIPTSSYGSTYVQGYFRRDGTYVRGHYRRRR
ncbi:MAG: hypothetical protein VKL59_23155 [Nostocaceae cyanobacterium]|nr:hypothetical protein [Nostocaceae cyanobacterium]